MTRLLSSFPRELEPRSGFFREALGAADGFLGGGWMAQGLGQPRLLQELEHAVRNKTSWLWLGPHLTESQKTLLRPVGERLRLQQCPRLWAWYLNRIWGGRVCS